MPVPPSTFLSVTARRSFEHLRVGLTPGPSVKLASEPTPSVRQAVQSFDYLAFIDQISEAICSAWKTWQSTATLVGITINGVTATGGRVVGPPWQPLILAKSPMTPPAMRLSQSVAAGLGGAWLQLTASMAVPGLLWYPAFAALPSPVAPPTPNIPTPVAALSMLPLVVSKGNLKASILATHPDASRADQNLYESLAEAFEQAFQLWKASTIVTNVLGTGPVPTFAPPYVPVGPVVGGVGTMTPGGFI